jgi:hypothetical protein
MERSEWNGEDAFVIEWYGSQQPTRLRRALVVHWRLGTGSAEVIGDDHLAVPAAALLQAPFLR